MILVAVALLADLTPRLTAGGPNQGSFAAQFKIPKIRIPDVKIPGLDRAKIPGLDSVLKAEPPLTTSLADALTPVPFLDGNDPEWPIPMNVMRRDEEGRFLLSLYGAYTFEARSYCLKAGTHGPGQGEGYLYAPLKGPRATIIQSVLRRSALHPGDPAARHPDLTVGDHSAGKIQRNASQAASQRRAAPDTSGAV